jgi:hypothetical protein
MAVIIIKANSNNSVMILIEFIGDPVPPVIGFGYLVIVQIIINAAASDAVFLPLQLWPPLLKIVVDGIGHRY